MRTVGKDALPCSRGAAEIRFTRKGRAAPSQLNVCVLSREGERESRTSPVTEVPGGSASVSPSAGEMIIAPALEWVEDMNVLAPVEV